MWNKNFSDIRGRQIFSIIFAILNSVGAVISSLYVQKIIDAVIAGNTNDIKVFAIQFLIVLVAFIVVTFIFQYLYRYLAYTGSFQIRRNLFRNLFQRDYLDIISFKEGDIVNIITSDSEQITGMYGTGVVILISMVVQLILIAAIMFYYNIYVALFAFISVLIGFFISGLASKKIGERTVELQAASGREHSHIIESVEGARTIKQLKKEDYFFRKYKDILDEKKEISNKLSVNMAVYADVFAFVSNIMPFATVLLSLYFVNKDMMTIGQMVAILSISGGLTEPITMIGNILNAKRIADALLKKNEKMLAKIEKVKKQELQSFDDLKFKSIGYSFGEKNILNGVDFSLHKGKVYSLVGPSGTGKSTIYNIILGFVDRQNTDVKINGLDIKEIDLSSLYDEVIQVDQKPFTINASILENITLGEKFDRELIDEVVSVCQLDILKAEKGMDFVIDDRGSNVSGGEKQRISIARVLLRKPSLLLLDEPTSALDENTAEEFVKSLISFGKKYNITLVTITHRQDFTKVSDEIISL